MHAVETAQSDLSRLVPLCCSCCLMRPTSPAPCCGDGWEWWRGGAPTALPPSFLSLHRHRRAVWSRPTSLQKRSTPQPAVITQPPPSENTHFNPPFLLKSHYLCPLFQRRGVQQQMRQNGWCRGGAKRGNNRGWVRCQLSAGIPRFGWEDQFLFLSLRASPRGYLSVSCGGREIKLVAKREAEALNARQKEY